MKISHSDPQHQELLIHAPILKVFLNNINNVLFISSFIFLCFSVMYTSCLCTFFWYNYLSCIISFLICCYIITVPIATLLYLICSLPLIIFIINASFFQMMNPMHVVIQIPGCLFPPPFRVLGSIRVNCSLFQYY